jgi:hypothetical protein
MIKEVIEVVEGESAFESFVVVALLTDATLSVRTRGDRHNIGASLYEAAIGNCELRAGIMLAASAFVEGDYTKEEIVEQAKNIQA